MISINTEIESVSVEIDGAVYELAPKTAAVAEELIAAQAKHIGQPEYKLWRAQLEILLGKVAVKELFRGGKDENLDRMERIHAGVFAAFDYNHEQIAKDRMNESADSIAAALAPVNELLRRLSQMDGGEKKAIQPKR